MEVNLALDVTAEEFFDTIYNSLEYDIKEFTGKNVRIKNIKPGYSYIKRLKSKMGHGADVKVTIEELEYPKIYVGRFDSSTGVNRIKYEVEDLENGQIGLSYSEEYEGAKKSYQMNGMLLNWLMSIPNKRALKKKFRILEDSIIAQRDMIGQETIDEDETLEEE